MTERCDSEKRQFVRVPVDLRVDYQFIDQSAPTGSEEVIHGHSANLGAGGLLLVGPVPDNGIIVDLLMRRVFVSLDIHLPGLKESIRTLARVAWVESIDVARKECSMGLMFKEITGESQDRLFRFIIDAVSS